MLWRNKEGICNIADYRLVSVNITESFRSSIILATICSSLTLYRAARQTAALATYTALCLGPLLDFISESSSKYTQM